MLSLQTAFIISVDTFMEAYFSWGSRSWAMTNDGPGSAIPARNEQYFTAWIALLKSMALLSKKVLLSVRVAEAGNR